MTPPALRFHNVVKHYGSTPVLTGVNLEVARGECVGLAGLNGAGKTSLLKCLLDFIAIDGGSIDIDGLAHRMPAARHPLTFLPERFSPPYFLTGAGFLRYMLKLQRVAIDPAAIQRTLASLGLDPSVMDQAVRQHSKGTSQKLGLAACFLSGKPIMVLDEPMSGLDPQARALFKTRLQQARSEGVTVLFSSHLLADVDALCDRMVVLHGGQIRFDGTPAACRQQTRSDTLEQAFLQLIQ